MTTGPFLLAHLYHLLYEITKGEPFETNLNGPTCMIQLWLQWYFLKLWAPNLEFPKGVAPARILAEGSPTNHSTFACLYFFRVYKTRANMEWGASVLKSSRQPVEMDVSQDEEVRDAFMLQETAVVEAERQGARLSISGLWATLTKKRTIAQASNSLKSSAFVREASVGPQVTKKPTIVSREDPLGVEMYQKAKDLQDSTLADLEPSPTQKSYQLAASIFEEPIVPEIPMVSEVTRPWVFPYLATIIDELPPPAEGQVQGLGEVSGISPLPLVGKTELHRPPLASEVTGTPIPRPKKKIKTTTSPSIITAPTSRAPPSVETSSLDAPSEGAGTRPSFPTSISSSASLLELFKVFGQLKTKLRSSRHPFASSGLQDQRRVFQEWSMRDFSSSFSLKALHDVEKAIIDLFKANHLSKAQYEYFLFYFKNLKALSDQYQRAERQANRLMDKGSAIKERIKVVTSEIQRLEEQLTMLRAKQRAILSKLHQQIEEIKKENSELEYVESQLVNSSTVLVELTRIFTIIQTYRSRIVTLGEDVNQLG
ncbi:TMV resistance protein N-like [Pyrus ussuriensis x Pyrus communis]|uniref:TMV resistance protein N-like n=1 Tax=Pyrus ussuriensis x Pyrus communis TaxID=2448454 RepID=A0A5N5F8N0_9ROSA|nr:TMV resistance protein N-like [Pyrus ussuriensis x Pyrus communis]